MCDEKFVTSLATNVKSFKKVRYGFAQFAQEESAFDDGETSARIY